MCHKGPNLVLFWSTRLFTDFSSKLDANLPIYVNFDWKIFSTNYSNRSQGPICKKNLLTTYLKFSITRLSWFLVLSYTIDWSSKILSDDTWRTEMKHDNTDRFVGWIVKKKVFIAKKWINHIWNRSTRWKPNMYDRKKVSKWDGKEKKCPLQKEKK